LYLIDIEHTLGILCVHFVKIMDKNKSGNDREIL